MVCGMHLPSRSLVTISMVALALTVAQNAAARQSGAETASPAPGEGTRPLSTAAALLAATPLDATGRREDRGSDVVAQPPRAVFPVLYSGFIATQALDVHSTLRAIDAGAVEANAAMRWATESPARFIALKSATTTGIVFVVEKLRKKHPKTAMFLLVGLNSASAVIVAHNYRTASQRQ
jgi:hypothetical protein